VTLEDLIRGTLSVAIARVLMVMGERWVRQHLELARPRPRLTPFDSRRVATRYPRNAALEAYAKACGLLL
jgi:hypothetical protein